MEHITSKIEYIPVAELSPHLDNPRKDLGDLSELADSIRQNGIMQNLTVVPKEDGSYTVVIGHRRLAAAKQAGLETVPCVVTDMDEKAQVRTMLLENMQRSDLTIFEQAQGFQMMLDLGDTVEEIAEKSGFSQTTVRRRVKMAELDQEKLREVSQRQLSLTDFDKLAQIDDIKIRNKCLDSIGTSDFGRKVTYEIRSQEAKKRMPLVKKELKSLGAKALKSSEWYSSQYESITSYIYIADWDEGTPLLNKAHSGKLFYRLDENSVQFFQKRKRAAPKKKSPEEQAEEKNIADAWAVIHEQAAVAYQLRSDFVKGLHYTQKNAGLILKGALLAGILKATDYMGSDRDTIMDMLGQDKNSYSQDRGIKVLAALAVAGPESYPALIYALFDDSQKADYTGNSFQKQYPEYFPSAKLNGLYAWLTDLGYEMSGEEKAMQDGSHEIFHRDEARPNNG